MLLIFEESAPSLHESQSWGRMNPQSVAVSTLPSFLISSQGGAVEGSRPNPPSGYCRSCFPRAPLTAEPLACSGTGCFFHTYVGCLDWGSSLGKYFPRIVFSWNCIFFCHGSMEEELSDIATKLLRVPMAFWSSFLSACQM